MEEMVSLFLPFFVLFPYLRTRQAMYKLKNDEKNDTKWINNGKKNYICKKYSSHRTFLLNYSYLCKVTNTSQT